MALALYVTWVPAAARGCLVVGTMLLLKAQRVDVDMARHSILCQLCHNLSGRI